MTKDQGVILWVAGAAGIILLYSAYKNKPISSVIAMTPNVVTPSTKVNTSGTATINTAPIDSNASGATPGATYTDYPAYQYDYNGNTVSLADIPSAYQNTPGTYVPARTAF